MKILKITQNLKYELAVPVPDDVNINDMSEKDRQEINDSIREQAQAQIESIGGKVVDFSMTAEVVEI